MTLWVWVVLSCLLLVAVGVVVIGVRVDEGRPRALQRAAGRGLPAAARPALQVRAGAQGRHPAGRWIQGKPAVGDAVQHTHHHQGGIWPQIERGVVGLEKVPGLTLVLLGVGVAAGHVGGVAARQPGAAPAALQANPHRRGRQQDPSLPLPDAAMREAAVLMTSLCDLLRLSAGAQFMIHNPDPNMVRRLALGRWMALTPQPSR